jgi:hypothetical protein
LVRFAEQKSWAFEEGFTNRAIRNGGPAAAVSQYGVAAAVFTHANQDYSCLVDFNECTVGTFLFEVDF